MALPTFTMKQLIEAGVHFGHNSRRWNPKMAEFLYGVKDSVHIINLEATVPMLYAGMKAIRDVAAAGGKVLFVGTKRQAQEAIKAAAERCGQYYVNHRWLGGTLTNWRTVSNSIKKLKDMEAKKEKGELEGLTKKEKLNLMREEAKLLMSFGGIKNMGGRPDIVFIIDTIKESLALAEAKKLGIPVVAICDSNSDPSGIDFPIPGNDDAIRAINLYCDLISGAVLDGIEAEMAASGIDIGAREKAVDENFKEKEEASVD